MRTSIPAVILLLLFLQIQNLHAQNGFTLITKVKIKRNTISMGFDKKGQLWMSDMYGVNRYNGTWTYFDSTNSPIKVWYRRTIAADMATGDIWVGGANLLKYDGSSWTVYDKSKGLPDNTAFDVSVFNSKVWVATVKGVALYDGSSWKTYNTSNSAISNDSVSWIKADRKGGAYVQLFNSKIYHFDGASSWKLINSTGKRLLNVDGEGRVWLLGQIYSNLPLTFFIIKNDSEFLANDLFDACSMDLTGYEWGQSSTLGGLSGAVVNSKGATWILKSPYLIQADKTDLHPYYLGGENGIFIGSSGAMAVDSTGKLWVQAQPNSQSFLKDTGIYVFNPGGYSREALSDAPFKFRGYNSLDINKVAAKNISSLGDMFEDFTDSYASNKMAQYEAPKGSCLAALQKSALWIGGYAPDSSLHLAIGSNESGIDFIPGPLDTTTGKEDTAIMDPMWIRPFKINRATIDDFRKHFADGSVTSGSYTIPYSITHWPAHGDKNRHEAHYLAPFVDYDHDGEYNPAKGDYPDIPGDQALFAIFNDGIIHTESKGEPMHVEIHLMAYAYNCDSIPENDSSEALNYTTFYRYTIINRSATDYKHTLVGTWNALQLGNRTDDYVGCVPSENYSYEYNSDNVDEGPFGYGKNPPMLSWVILHSPQYDTSNSPHLPLMSHFMRHVVNFSNQGYPTQSIGYYYYLNSKWLDGSDITYGGKGIGGSKSANFMFPDNPYSSYTTLWNETTANIGPGVPMGEGGQYALTSAGPFTLKAGEAVNFEYAIVYSRDEDHPNGLTTSFAKNGSYINSIKSWYYNNNFPHCANSPTAINSPVKKSELNVYPVPAHDAVYVAYQPVHNDCTYSIISTSGCVVRQGFYSSGQAISLSEMMPGTYIVRVVDGSSILSTLISKY
jgi:hypothetical protein